MKIPDRLALTLGALIALASVAFTPVADVVRSTASSVYSYVYGETADVACLTASPATAWPRTLELALCASDRAVVEHAHASTGTADGMFLSAWVRKCDVRSGACSVDVYDAGEEDVETEFDPLLEEGIVAGQAGACRVDVRFTASGDPEVTREQTTNDGQSAGPDAIGFVLGGRGVARVDRDADAAGSICGHGFGPADASARMSRGVRVTGAVGGRVSAP